MWLPRTTDGGSVSGLTTARYDRARLMPTRTAINGPIATFGGATNNRMPGIEDGTGLERRGAGPEERPSERARNDEQTRVLKPLRPENTTRWR